ncbi:hypothetical protein I7I51_02447 [Histoplasma capsulatum]|uniref:Uncharacterized protein n=1 Tax=Ajellomyces capsulatus TaxID=5037 RepID=A0A8A1M865_AJECA|nr:hypothetical protein I7I51_02447 [Histoplasma capsulatum]
MSEIEKVRKSVEHIYEGSFDSFCMSPCYRHHLQIDSIWAGGPITRWAKVLQNAFSIRTVVTPNPTWSGFRSTKRAGTPSLQTHYPGPLQTDDASNRVGRPEKLLIIRGIFRI